MNKSEVAINNNIDSDILQRICTDKRRHIAEAKAALPEARLQARLSENHSAKTNDIRGFKAAIAAALIKQHCPLIAEIKRASPSKGRIRSVFDPAACARAYEAGGAVCLSVLTDIPYFQGEDTHLVQARAACMLPVLRKDFILDPYQVIESRALGADCLLLIMAALSDGQAAELVEAAHTIGLDVLIEVHNIDECHRALSLNGDLIGINNRNLKDLTVDLAITEKVAPLVPTDQISIAESGLHNSEDLLRMRAAGVGGFLIGESLMRQTDLISAVQDLTAPYEKAIQIDPGSEP